MRFYFQEETMSNLQGAIAAQIEKAKIESKPRPELTGGMPACRHCGKSPSYESARDNMRAGLPTCLCPDSLAAARTATKEKAAALVAKIAQTPEWRIGGEKPPAILVKTRRIVGEFIAGHYRRLTEHEPPALPAGLPIALYISGPKGCGKTTLTAGIVAACNGAGISSALVNENDIHDMVASKIGEGAIIELRKKMGASRLLIIDDIGAKLDSYGQNGDWLRVAVSDIYGRVFESRHRAGRPIILSSNLSPQAVEALLTDRPADRFAGLFCGHPPINMAGLPSYRRQWDGRP
jgi:hypothetical protein